MLVSANYYFLYQELCPFICLQPVKMLRSAPLMWFQCRNVWRLLWNVKCTIILMVRKSMKHTLCLQLCMDVVWVCRFSLQGRVQEQVCCCHTAGVQQTVGRSICSTGGFVEHLRLHLRPGNLHRDLREGTFSSDKSYSSLHCLLLCILVHEATF